MQEFTSISTGFPESPQFAAVQQLRQTFHLLEYLLWANAHCSNMYILIVLSFLGGGVGKEV